MVVSGLWLPLIALSTMVNGITTSEWCKDYNEGLQRCKQENKPLLVVIYQGRNESSDRIQNASFSSSVSNAVHPSQNLLLQSYVLCKIDVTTPHGAEVAKAFQATEFPFTAIIDKTGSRILHSQAGKFTVSRWDSMLNKYKLGQIPTRAIQYRSEPGRPGGSPYRSTIQSGQIPCFT